MNQENSLNMQMSELINLQKQQLGEISALRQNSGFSRPRNIPFTTYSMDYDRPAPFSSPTMQSLNNAMFNANAAKSNFGSLFQPISKVGSENKELLAMRYGANVANAGIAFGGALAGGAGDLAGGALVAGAGGGLIGAIAGGALFGAAAAGTTKIVGQQVKQFQELNEYLFSNSYRFINRDESTNLKYGVGFDDSQRYEAVRFLRELNSQKGLKDEEVTRMMQQFTEYDLMKSVSDTKSFKEQMSKLVDAVKTSAITLKESYDNVTQMMGDMKKAGIDVGKFDLLAAGAYLAGSYAGKTPMEIMSMTVPVAQGLTVGTGLNATQIQENLQFAVGMESKIYSKLEEKAAQGIITPKERQMLHYYKNSGGAEAVAMRMRDVTNTIIASDYNIDFLAYTYDYDEESKAWTINNERMKRLFSGDVNYDEVRELSREQLENNNAKVSIMNEKNRSVMARQLNEVDAEKLSRSVTDMQMKYGYAKGLSYASTLELLYGSEIDPQAANIIEMRSDFYNQMGDEEYTKFLVDAAMKNAQSIRESTAYTPLQRIGMRWELFKDKLSSPAVAGAEKADSWFRKFMDNISGRSHANYKIGTKYDYDISEDIDLKDAINKNVTDALTYFSDKGVKGLDIRKITGKYAQDLGIDSYGDLGTIAGYESGKVTKSQSLADIEKDLSSKIKEIDRYIKRKTFNHETIDKETEEQYAKLLAVQKSIGGYKEKAIQHGELSYNAMQVLFGADNIASNEFMFLAESHKRKIDKGASIGDIEKMMKQQEDFLFSKIKDNKENIADILGTSGMANVLDLNDVDFNHLKDEDIRNLIKQLINQLQTSYIKDEDGTAKSSQSRISEISTSLDEHKKAIDKMIDKFQDEIDSINKFIYREKLWTGLF